MVEERRLFWSETPETVIGELDSSTDGLSDEEAARRMGRFGLNALATRRRFPTLSLLIAQFKSPIIVILLAAALLSAYLHDSTDALIILGIVFTSGLLGFWQERGARSAVDKLLAMVQIRASVLRGGSAKELPVELVVPGDVILLAAGDSVPGDCLILESKDLFVDEALLTGETYPSEKSPGVLPAQTSLSGRSNCVFAATHVISGTARALVVHTGTRTELGAVSERLALKTPETEFERGVRRFGYFLMEVTLMLVMGIFAVNVYLARPVLESFLFSLALAVGLTPQLLPAIISVNLSHGARRMAGKRVIVKRLAAIENFGAMNVLCSDKTGTLTQGTIEVHDAFDGTGGPGGRALLYAYVNASFETGFVNPIDEAVRAHGGFDLGGYEKLDEVPYDFNRKRLSVLVYEHGQHVMVTKGAFMSVLSVCATLESASGEHADMEPHRNRLEELSNNWSNQGFRLLGVAYRVLEDRPSISKEDERDMIFAGAVALSDRPKPGVKEVIDALKALGVSLKIITGDNRFVAGSVSRAVGLPEPSITTGQELLRMSGEALASRVRDTDVFAEVEPNQKERIILALKKAGNVVGYMGDGINDASALHAADAGISVDSAVDVAKEAADIVLLEKDLAVLVEGVKEGRVTFANTLKYVFMATSANFGNMFSMAGASLFLPFLPLLPKQILLTNLLTDFPEMAIATDSVDEELVSQPRRWNIRFIRNFMLVFGALSSIFDYLTFGTLLILLRADAGLFRTGWFCESVISAAVIVLVIRSRRPFFRSRPGRYLALATAMVVAFTVLLPSTPIARIFSFQPFPPIFIVMVGVIVGLYALAAEVLKRLFYRKVSM